MSAPARRLRTEQAVTPGGTAQREGPAARARTAVAGAHARLQEAPGKAVRPPRPLLVVGDCMLDRYWDGAVDRISPEAPVPVLQVRHASVRAGGAANVALNLVALGSRVRLATLLGRDVAGAELSALLADHGVGLDAVQDAGLKTTEKIRGVARRQQLLRIDFEAPPPAASVEALTRRAAALLPRHDWLLLSDYAKGSLARCGELIAAAAACGCRVLVDPKGRDFARYRGAFVLKPNEAEVRAVVGDWADEADFLARAHALRADAGVANLLVTRGEHGMTLFSAGGLTLRIPTEAREVYDVSGAGDTVLATLAHCLAEGRPLDDAVRWANRAAGLVVAKFGTASVTREELGLDAGVAATVAGAAYPQPPVAPRTVLPTATATSGAAMEGAATAGAARPDAATSARTAGVAGPDALFGPDAMPGPAIDAEGPAVAGALR